MGEVDNIIKKVIPYYKKAKPAAEYKLIYDSSSETLEPVYFWILDFMNGMFQGKVEKLIDNFASSPGSGHFSELQGKASQMQQESSRVLGTVNNILKGIINLIYDLKEFKLRLSQYESANSKDSATKEAGLLGLKQIWMDKVDMQRGQGSINGMSSGNLQFVTLRDAFMMVNSPEEVEKLDLNERVKRVLKPRVQEFLEWRKRSEQELKKRYEIEKIYLKSQVDALKLNSRWARPYLRAAEKLRQSESLGNRADLITAFNSIYLQLTIMGIGPISIKDSVEDKVLPRDFIKMQKSIRNYNSVVLVDFDFRGIPSKAGQHYTFGGRVEVNFKAYALTDKELELLKLEMRKMDLQSALLLVEGMTEESLGQIQVDIDEILTDKKKDEKSSSEDLNPFSALFSIFKSESKKEKEEKSKKTPEEIDKENYAKYEKEVKKSENYAEKYVRNLALADAANRCFSIYDIYKKGHGMVAFPYADERTTKLPQSDVEKWLGWKK